MPPGVIMIQARCNVIILRFSRGLATSLTVKCLNFPIARWRNFRKNQHSGSDVRYSSGSFSPFLWRIAKCTCTIKQLISKSSIAAPSLHGPTAYKLNTRYLAILNEHATFNSEVTPAVDLIGSDGWDK